MPFKQEKDSILQPHSWETIIALEARRPLEELTSSPAPTALHATARAFIISTYQKPTLYSTKYLAECISTYNRRQEQWQKRQAELREEQQDEQDDVEYQQLTSAAQANYQFSTLAYVHEQITYYTNLLPSAQKSADGTSYLQGLIPVSLSPQGTRQSMATLLNKHGVIYTPVSIVETIKKCIRFYQLLFKVFLYDAAIDNELLENFAEYVSPNSAEFQFFSKLQEIDCPPWPGGLPRENMYESFVQNLPQIHSLFDDLKNIPFTTQELAELDAWIALQEEFFEAVPFPVPQQDKVLIAEVVPQLPAPSPLALPEPKPLTLNPQKKLKLPKIHHKTTLLNVCKFFYGLSQDDTFATVPTTSQGVKALIDKLPTPAFTQLYSKLVKEPDMQLAVQYKLAVKLLGEFYSKFQEQECQAQTHKGLSEIAAFGRTDCSVQEDPAKDYRTEPQDAVAYLNNEEENSLSEDEIQAQIHAIQDKFPDGVPPLVYDQQIAPLCEKLHHCQVLDRKRAAGVS